MNQSLRQLLEHQPIFAQFGDAQLSLIAESAVRRRHEAGAFVTCYGDVWPYLLLVETGSLEVVKESCEGKQLVALSLGPGDAFWGLAFFNEGMETPVAVHAREDSNVSVWSRDQIQPLLMETPQALWTLCQQMVTRMNQASRIVENLAFKPMAKRLAGLLLELFSETGEACLKRNLTLDDIAARVGSTREEVCRVLYQFSDKRLIEITRTEFFLVDKDGLARLVEPRSG